MKVAKPKLSDVVLLGLATLLIFWPQLIIPLRSSGTVSFALAYRKVRFGMTWGEWQELQRQHGVECVCDATDCYVDDLLRTYNVTFRSSEGEPLRVYSKRVYVHSPIWPSWRLLHR
jgi:hypothetical protein